MSNVQVDGVAVAPVVAEKAKRGRARGVPTVPLALLVPVVIAQCLRGVKSPDTIAEVAVNRTPKGPQGETANLSGRQLIQRLFGKPFSPAQVAEVTRIVNGIAAKHKKAAAFLKWVDIEYVDDKNVKQVGQTLDAGAFGLTAPARKTNVDISALEDLFADIESGDESEAEAEADTEVAS